MSHHPSAVARRVIEAYFDFARATGSDDLLPQFLALLFLKNEHTAPSAGGAGPRRQLVLSREHRWELLEHGGKDLAQRLDAMMEASSEANPWLRACVEGVRFSPLRMGPLPNKNVVLGRLIQQISTVPFLDDRTAPEVCDTLLAHVEASQRSLSLPPNDVCDMLATLLGPEEGSTVHDPVCGVGECLAACRRYRLRISGDTVPGRDLVLSGREPSSQLQSVCRLRALFSVRGEPFIALGDVLRESPMAAEGVPVSYQHVICCPPIGRRFDPELFHGHHDSGPAGTFPRTSFADLAYVYHALSVLRPGGTAAILVSRGPLFRGTGEQEARSALVRARLVRAVVELPPNLLSYTSLPVFAVLLRHDVRRGEREGVVFVDASRIHGAAGRKNVLRPEDIERIAQLCSVTNEDSAPCRYAGVEEIASHAWSLNPRTYSTGSRSPSGTPIEILKAEIAALEASRDDAAMAMDRAASALMAVSDASGGSS